MSEFIKVASRSDILAGCGKVVEASGRRLAVFNCDDSFYALDNTCPHRGGPLGEGSVSGTSVTCPWHAWEFDVTTGASLNNPAAKVASFETKVDGDDILVAI